MKILRHIPSFIALVLLTACDVGQNQGNKSTSNSQGTLSENYQLPSDITLDTVAERAQDGKIFLSGSTNLPDGVKIGVEIPNITWKENFKDFQGRSRLATRVSQDMNMIVQGGRFRSPGFLMKDSPYPVGPHKVHFFAYFNGAWQSKDVLKRVGDGGKKLKGKIFKKEDPDVIDSDLTVDYVVTVPFPPMPPETQAINIVKKAILTVPDRGRSSMTVEDGIKWFMGPNTGVTPGKGWSAKADSGSSYTVTFDFTDASAGESQAIWTVDRVSRKVQYINKYAKYFSYIPPD
jgi:hypothetical protein